MRHSPIDAILLACWPCEDVLLNGLEVDPALLVLADKPMLQRALERLVELHCRNILVVLGGERDEAALDGRGTEPPGAVRARSAREDGEPHQDAPAFPGWMAAWAETILAGRRRRAGASGSGCPNSASRT